MSGARVPFDPDLPIVVATQDGLPIGGQVVARGQVLQWRELGLSEWDLLQLYTFYKIDCVPFVDATESVPEGTLRAIRTDDGQVLVVARGEAVHVQPPAAIEPAPVEPSKPKRKRPQPTQPTE